MHVAAESALEHVFGLHFYPLRAFAHLMSDLGTVVADVVLRVVLGQLLEQFLGAVEVLLDEDLGVVVCALGSFLAVPVHVVPTEFAHYVLVLAHLALETETHVEVRAALVHVPVGTVLSLLALLAHEVGADLQVVAEVALVAVPALAHAFEFVAGLYFALVVGVGAVVRESALAVDELFADAVGGEFVVVGGSDGRGSWLLGVDGCVLQVVVVALEGRVWVHLSIIVNLRRLKLPQIPAPKPNNIFYPFKLPSTIEITVSFRLALDRESSTLGSMASNIWKGCICDLWS